MNSSPTPSTPSGAEEWIIPVHLLESRVHRHDQSDAELLGFFETEAKNEINKIQGYMHSLHDGESLKCLTDLHVSFHNLTGAANSIGQLRIGSLAGAMQEIVATLNKETLPQRKDDLTKLILLVIDAIKKLLLEARTPETSGAHVRVVIQAARAVMPWWEEVPK